MGRTLQMSLFVLGIMAVTFAPVAQAKETSCAKAKVVSGTTCQSLVVKFDLSGCGAKPNEAQRRTRPQPR
ncbi:MAG: hypothetical protein HY075_12685 [Deltaproteobacteria bacterium]|nr:hypothetical protein [Deltaproteobacteria bacterium]